ncbi:protein TIFY 10a-like [Canna indica]|uniref:Protein TIFY n=1 Tax=Canna indica TaxID=4628 RepID=A0AAQ3JUK4_9LILI|nr:protein TIFY 10a-like [Canna indica]
MEKRREKPVEKSHFSLTCSLLSQYLKKNGGFGDLGLVISPNAPLGQAEGSKSSLLLHARGNFSGKDYFCSENCKDTNASNSVLLSKNPSFNSCKPSNRDCRETRNGQLTIFYGGKVVVFDNFPEHKVMNLMSMASEERMAADPTVDRAPKNNSAPVAGEEPAVALQDKPNQANSSDMPIARRNSLHRFLEKRKDRMGKTPYQLHDDLLALKQEKNLPWLSLGPRASNSEDSS